MIITIIGVSILGILIIGLGYDAYSNYRKIKELKKQVKLLIIQKRVLLQKKEKELEYLRDILKSHNV